MPNASSQPEFDAIVCVVSSRFVVNLPKRAMDPFTILVEEHRTRSTGKIYVTQGNKRFHPDKFGKITSDYQDESAQKQTVCLKADLAETIERITAACREQVEANIAKQLRIKEVYASAPLVKKKAIES